MKPTLHKIKYPFKGINSYDTILARIRHPHGALMWAMGRIERINDGVYFKHWKAVDNSALVSGEHIKHIYRLKSRPPNTLDKGDG